MGEYLFEKGTFEDEGTFDKFLNKGGPNIKRASYRMKLASRNKLPNGFFKMGSTDIVVHKCPFELWKISSDGSEIVRMFNDSKKPVEG